MVLRCLQFSSFTLQLQSFVRMWMVRRKYNDRLKYFKEHVSISKSGVLGSVPGLATYFRFSFRFFKKGSCQLLAKVCTQSTG